MNDTRTIFSAPSWGGLFGVGWVSSATTGHAKTYGVRKKSNQYSDDYLRWEPEYVEWMQRIGGLPSPPPGVGRRRRMRRMLRQVQKEGRKTEKALRRPDVESYDEDFEDDTERE